MVRFPNLDFHLFTELLGRNYESVKSLMAALIQFKKKMVEPGVMAK